MVLNGLDRLLLDPAPYRNRRIGLIANQTSVTADLRYSWTMLEREGIRLTRLFSPEHGIFSTEQDQISVERQPDTGCQVVSLYGSSESSLLPAREQLEGLDMVLFDIQDVGSRYYTYVNTLALFMEAATGLDLEILVLDRPNPLGGNHVEGPLLEADYHSFVGVMPVPVRHGLTAGEIARFYLDYRKLDINLGVIRMEGWNRSMLFPETGLPWVPPSPNMPTFEAAEVYPGMCLFEGLNISEGRGTTTPFLISGAPFIDPSRLAEHLGRLGLEGIVFRPTWFRPTFHKYRDEVIGGLYLHVTDHERFRPFATGVAMATAIRELYGEQLRFLDGVYEFRDTVPAFDLLAGSGAIRTKILAGEPAGSIISSWEREEASFAARKGAFHLYEA